MSKKEAPPVAHEVIAPSASGSKESHLNVPTELILSSDQVVKDPLYGKIQSFEFQDEKSKRFLMFEGVAHAGDPAKIEEDEQMMSRLQQRFDEFVQKSREAGGEPFVIVEGGNLTKIPTEEAEARKNEMLFTAFLAEKAGVRCESPEPTNAEQAEHVLKQGFSAERIVSTFVMRQLKGRVAKIGEGEAYVESATDLVREQIALLDQLKPAWNLPKGKFTKESYAESVRTWFDYMQTLSDDKRPQEERDFKQYTQELGEAFVRAVMDDIKKADGVDLMSSMNGDRVELDREKVSEYTHLDDDHIRERSTNKLRAEMVHYRDEKIVTEIAKAKKAGQDVFIVFGSYHATAQKPALKKIFQG